MGATVKVASSLSDEFDPDIIDIRVSIEGVGDDKQGAVKAYNARHDFLVESLAAAGVSKDEVTTSYLYLSPEWEENDYRKTRHRTGRYEFSASIEFSIPCEEDLYERVWGASSPSTSMASRPISTTASKITRAREMIIRRAVKAGRKRAASLADATDCDLSPVARIENGLRGDAYYRRDLAAGSAPAGDAGDLEAPAFSPSPVSVNCEVTLEYELIPRQG